MKKQVWFITGGVASGKSQVLQYFKNKGYDTFSADEAARWARLEKEIRREIPECPTGPVFE